MIAVNPFIVLWWASGIFSVVVFLHALHKRSWVWMLVSALFFLPIAYYFGGAENAFALIGLIPLVHLALAILFFGKNIRSKGK